DREGEVEDVETVRDHGADQVGLELAEETSTVAPDGSARALGRGGGDVHCGGARCAGRARDELTGAARNGGWAARSGSRATDAGCPPAVTPLRISFSSWEAVSRPSVVEVDDEKIESMCTAPPPRLTPFKVFSACTVSTAPLKDCLVWAWALSTCRALLSEAAG